MHDELDMHGAGIAGALQRGLVVSDRRFDALLPFWVRAHSSTFWTPVEVASTAARWFEYHGAHRVLDVGAGIGKFCAVGTLVTGVDFDGVEHRGHLLDHARGLARRLGIATRIGPLRCWRKTRTRSRGGHWLEESGLLVPADTGS